MELLLDQLLGGYVDSVGCVHKAVELRALTGREEELLAASGRESSAALVTTILSRCVQRIGTVSPVTEDVARALLVGDRHYLLLKLREVTFGTQIQAAVPCPWPNCGKRMDIDFHTTDIPVKKVKVERLIYEMQLATEEDTDPYSVRFRLPNGSDQELLAPLLTQNEAEALTVLLTRCLVSVGDESTPSPETIRSLSPAARQAIEQQMEQLAPGIDLSMETQCPECGREFTAPFDLQDFFFGEFRTSLDLLRREVHYLAFHYHWRESDILNMTRDKRRSYIEILADEIEKMNDAAAR
jgi:hypothetical protein